MGSIRQTVGSDPQQPDSQFAAYAYLPVFPFEREHPDEPYDSMDAENSREIFQLAVSIAALDTTVSQPMANVYRKWIEFYQRKSGMPYQEQPHLRRPVHPGEVASVLQRWLEASRDLPARRRAAALLAAQFMLEVSWAEFTSAAGYPLLRTDTDTQTMLESAGAEFRIFGHWEFGGKASCRQERDKLQIFVPIHNLGYCATHLSKREAKVWARYTVFSSGHAIW
jgi:hypothetical protein